MEARRANRRSLHLADIDFTTTNIQAHSHYPVPKGGKKDLFLEIHGHIFAALLN